jgi:hypothetical protein
MYHYALNNPLSYSDPTGWNPAPPPPSLRRKIIPPNLGGRYRPPRLREAGPSFEESHTYMENENGYGVWVSNSDIVTAINPSITYYSDGRVEKLIFTGQYGNMVIISALIPKSIDGAIQGSLIPVSFTNLFPQTEIKPSDWGLKQLDYFELEPEERVKHILYAIHHSEWKEVDMSLIFKNFPGYSGDELKRRHHMGRLDVDINGQKIPFLLSFFTTGSFYRDEKYFLVNFSKGEYYEFVDYTETSPMIYAGNKVSAHIWNAPRKYYDFISKFLYDD